MSLKLSKNNAPAYNYLSEGDMSNPATVAVTIDKLGGTKTSAALIIYLVAAQAGNANIGSYTGITITPSTEQAGITWEISLNGSTWLSAISPADMDCSTADVVTPVHVRVVANNAEDTPLATGNYAGEFAIEAVENPPV